MYLSPNVTSLLLPFLALFSVGLYLNVNSTESVLAWKFETTDEDASGYPWTAKLALLNDLLCSVPNVLLWRIVPAFRNIGVICCIQDQSRSLARRGTRAVDQITKLPLPSLTHFVFNFPVSFASQAVEANTQCYDQRHGKLAETVDGCRLRMPIKISCLKFLSTI